MKPEMSLRAIAAAAIIAALGGCATMKDADEKPSGRERMTLIEMRAVVVGVDHDRRLVGLKTSDGAATVIPVAQEFRDFEKLHAGDEVMVSYTEAIAWKVKPSGSGAPGASASQTLSNAKAGEPAGGAMENAITITATIGAIDRERGTVTLDAPDGSEQVVKVNTPADLDHVRAGDLVDITYSQVRALSLRSADKP